MPQMIVQEERKKREQRRTYVFKKIFLDVLGNFVVNKFWRDELRKKKMDL